VLTDSALLLHGPSSLLDVRAKSSVRRPCSTPTQVSDTSKSPEDERKIGVDRTHEGFVACFRNIYRRTNSRDLGMMLANKT